ncbi:MAG: hypothetical protein QY322_03180 [bacterium]|nr:MAG: hypothetical protein QY322_03180 [bacterium]
MNKLTQIELFENDGYEGFGSLGLEGGITSSTSAVIFQNFISTAIGLVSIIAIVWFVIIIITSGISYMGAGSDQKATEAARKRITNGLIGLLITIFGIFIINLMGQIFNIEGILQIPNLLDRIQIK